MAKPVLPRRFEDRGTAVPFESRALRLTRLRVVTSLTSLEWEATIAGFWGGSSRQMLVVQWRQLPAVAQMSPRDETLYRAVDRLEDAEDIDPFVIHDIVLKVDDRLGRGKGATNLEQVERDITRTSLLARIAQECGRAGGDRGLVKLGVDWVSATDQKRAANAAKELSRASDRLIAFLAGQIDSAQEEARQRLESMTDLLTPVGGVGLDPAVKEDGYLIRFRNRLRLFDREMLDYEKDARREMSDPTAMIRFAVKQYLSYVEDRLSMLEDRLVHLPLLLREYDRATKFITKTRRQIAFALDGWPILINLWDEAQATGDAVRVEEAVMFIFTNAPLMPLQEIDTTTESGKVWRGYESARGSLVKMMHGWNDGEPDQNLLNRVESAKAGEKKAAGRRKREVS